MSRILVIDDSELVGQLLADSLTEHGFEVEVAHDASTGFKMAMEHPPSLILLDVQLPDVTGFEALKVIRSREPIKHVPVILITGTAHSTAEKVKGFQTGADDYVLKPFEMDELLERMKRLLNPRRTASPIAPPSDPVLEPAKVSAAALPDAPMPSGVVEEYNATAPFDDIPEPASQTKRFTWMPKRLSRVGAVIGCALIAAVYLMLRPSPVSVSAEAVVKGSFAVMVEKKIAVRMKPSPELSQLKQALTDRKATLKEAIEELRRRRDLLNHGSVSRSSVLRAEKRVVAADAALTRAQQDYDTLRALDAKRPPIFKTMSLPGQTEMVLHVPAAAVVQDGGTKVVWKVLDRRLRRQVVQVGRSGAERLEIVSGLQLNDHIVTGPQPGLKEGARVKIRPPGGAQTGIVRAALRQKLLHLRNRLSKGLE